jgi:tRNA threonylcarbamoyladenosine biosynthesis protein TsaE
MQYIIPDITSIPSVASQFLTDYGHKKIFAFEAEMGTGKTTFILGLLRAMGIEAPEGSPTYSLVNSYESPMYGKIYHFDLYRIEDEEEAYDIGIEEMLYENTVYCFIEWAENVKNLLPMNTVTVKMKINENGERVVEVD